MWTAALKERSPSQEHFIRKATEQNKKPSPHACLLTKEWFRNTSVILKNNSLIGIWKLKRNLFAKQGADKVCSISELLLEIQEAGIIFSAAERPGIFQAISQSLLLYHPGHKPTNYEGTQISIVSSSDIHYPSSEKINTCIQKLNKLSSELKVSD